MRSGSEPAAAAAALSAWPSSSSTIWKTRCLPPSAPTAFIAAAATDADTNLTDFDNIDIIEGTVEDVLPALDDDPYDAALLDPPGEGMSVEVIDALAERQIQRLIYVSSDPATLARDCKRLAGHGYHLLSVQPIDLAPQTYYIDSIAVLARRDV